MVESALRRRWRLFELFWAPRMRRSVREVLVTGLPREIPDNRPVLLCANHVSWWDGFILRSVQALMRPDVGLRTLMLERELRPRPFLRLLGAEGLEPGSLGSLRGAARRMAGLRAASPRMVTAFFPQGRIRTSRTRPLDFRPGVRLFRRMLQPVWTLPVALHLEFLNRAAATAFVSVGQPLSPADPAGREASVLDARVAAELDAVLDFLDRNGESSLRKWPGPFESLPEPFRGPAGADPAGADPGRQDPFLRNPTVS